VAFRGFFAVDDVEIANSSRVAAHLGMDPPTNDLGVFGNPTLWVETPLDSGLYAFPSDGSAVEDPAGSGLYAVTLEMDADGLYIIPPGPCELVSVGDRRLLSTPSASMAPIAPGRLLYTPPDGTRLYSPLLGLVGDCWSPENMCFSCRGAIIYDDTWLGLQEMLQDTVYRPELAPWYSTQVPESAEFGGIWVMDVQGLDGTPTQRDVTENAGDGGSPGPQRDGSRRIKFDALLVACSNAGLTHGLQWLKNRLRATNNRTDSVLRYLSAHPGDSGVDPTTLLRELHGVVLTQEPQVTQAVNASRGQHSQATMYRVSWELTATRPFAYSPPLSLAVDWDEIDTVAVEWVHAADCQEPTSCAPMPALFAADCVIDKIAVVATPPPTCGGCMPVSGVQTYVYNVPTFTRPFRTSETSVTTRIVNTGATNVTLQSFWRRCNARSDCDTSQWPLQVTSLPPKAELVLDGISRKYWVNLESKKRRPFGMVDTPTGAPWQPPIIDRSLCWEFVVVAASDASFDVTLVLTDREA
jgi:hypothetical protein